MPHIPRILAKALCLMATVALPLGLFFAAPWGEGGPQAVPRPSQTETVACDISPQEAETLLLPLPQPWGSGKARQPGGPLAWALPTGLPALLLACRRASRFPLYLPVFQRHVLVRVGTHAPPA